MDLPEIWKIASIPLTGAFAILGLSTETKDKETGKLNKWGITALAGILVSTTGGVASQWIDSENNIKNAITASDNQKYLRGQLNIANDQILKILTPLEGAAIDFEIKFNCSDKRFTQFCKDAINSAHYGYDIDGDAEQFHFSKLKLNIPMKISILHGHKSLQHIDQDETDSVYAPSDEGADYSNTSVSVQWEMPNPKLPAGWGATEDCQSKTHPSVEQCMLMKGVSSIDIEEPDGTIVGVPDLKNTTIILSSPDNNFKNSFRAFIAIRTKSGVSVELDYDKSQKFTDVDGFTQFAWYN